MGITLTFVKFSKFYGTSYSFELFMISGPYMTKPITMLCNGSIRRLPPSPCHNRFQPVALPCCLACSTYMLQGVRTAVQWCLYAAAGGGRNASAGAAWGGAQAAGMPHHPVRGRPGLPSQGSPPLPTTSVEHNITKVVEVHTYFAIQCTQSAFDISL